MRPLVFALLLCASAAADESSPEARQHFVDGNAAFKRGEYALAIEEFQRSYDLFAAPVLLYDIAQSHRLSGHPREALEWYRRYVAAEPNGKFTKNAEKKIGEIVAAQMRQGEWQQPPPSPSPEAAPPVVSPPSPEPRPAIIASAPEKPRRGLTIAGGALVGAGLALAAAGTAFAIVGRMAFDEINSPSKDYVFMPATESRMKLYEPLGFSLIGIGAAATVSGVVVLVVARRR
jgi:iron complex outermembrane receptor protein